MTRPAIAIAAAMIAATTLTNAKPAEAGVRLGFGVPLGMFVAHSLAESSRRAHYDDLRAQRQERAARIAAAKREAAIAAAKREAALEERERARKAKLLAKASEPVTSNDAKLVTTDAAPTINVPATPAAATTSAPVATEIAKVGEVDDAVKIAAPKTEQLQQVVTVEPVAQPAVQPAAQPTESATSKAKRICRRFSAAIAGLVDVPCE